ncbi:hypothetical protein NQ317_004803, partial [Molorchus minor]
FSADEFVENLLTEGSKIACDDTSAIFNNSLHVPYFYNEEMFKNGQRFFRRNMFGLFLSKFMGLVILLTVPTSLKILIMTNMSSTNLTAYRRYVATIFHMCLWYDENFKPGSRSWESLFKVRSMHNSASKKNYSRMNFRISQMDMALTQFGFMGFGLVRKRMMGIHDVTDAELKGFVHLWRTVGYILGIEDRFNICRESLKETQEICNLLIEKVFLHHLEQPPREFYSMSRALVGGMWPMNPFLQYDVFLLYLRMTVDNSQDTKTQPCFKDLGVRGKIKLYVIFYTLWVLQYNVFRKFYNYVLVVTLWLMHNFPFLAYYEFGRKNSHVSILS